MINFIFSFFLSLFLLFLLLETKLKSLAVDKPNERSLHNNLIPRTGGLAIMISVLITWLFIGIPFEWGLLPTVLIAISVIDDIRGLKARWRFLAQTIVCAIFLALYPQNLLPSVMPMLLLAMVWMVNLYNFMDGSDGLAGGMALFGFGAYSVAAYLAGSTDLAALCASVAGASLAFLLFNFHPAKIFMGDAGSIPLGFLAAAVGLFGWQQGVWSYWFPLLVFSPFIVDASATLLKRILRRERIWEAHKTHYYQRLVQMGWGHRNTALAEYGMMLAAGSSGILTMHYGGWLIAVVGVAWVLLYIVIMMTIDRTWARRQV
jgi:UDP-GlcNAc:undecaprenyl-phosphate GlcNAc-1-phosphate transferase